METNKIKEAIDKIIEPIINTSIKKNYGEPINSQGKTIIPVAKIAFGFGGGIGEKNKGSSDKINSPADKNASSNEGGGGMGGGMAAKPIGYIEITPETTRFVRFDTMSYIFTGFALGLFLSRFLKITKN